MPTASSGKQGRNLRVWAEMFGGKPPGRGSDQGRFSGHLALYSKAGTLSLWVSEHPFGGLRSAAFSPLQSLSPSVFFANL